MTAHSREDSDAIDKRRLSKFLRRSAPPLGEPIIALRDPEHDSVPAMTLHWESKDGENWSIAQIDRHLLDKRSLDSVAVECRVFFMSTEDCYLPGIVKALQRLSPTRARALDPLKKHVAQMIRGGELVDPEGGSVMYSGRLDMDNGLGPGKLLGAAQMTMDYINGIAFHEDEVRRSRLENVSGMESVLQAVTFELDLLLHIVANVRAQVLHDIEAGHIDLES